MAHHRPHRLSCTLALLLALTLVTPTGPAAAAQRAQPGKYAGNVLDAGKPSKKEYVRFTVKGRRVVKLKGRVWVHCYTYPSTYTQLPVVFTMPKAKIKRNKIDKSWKTKYKVDGESYTFTGRVKLSFKKRGKVSGRLSVDFANCASRLGDPPYWVKLKARKR
ncbi:hypothetical protein [Nocardioides alcanivorans]|uniref:hypothetical protein n=1 Tax=Nocardioides alcanivorans TaxID=2897352 RepID=UPI001F2C9DC7|nr:hypothetical protein [Nocardioides alcanivorans]